jgi:hypothetical protein
MRAPRRLPDLDPWARLALSLLALGIAVRALLYFPIAAFQVDPDGVLAGLCAFRILDGQHPIFFPGGTRLSAASCYVTAGYFHLFGIGRTGLALTGLTWGILYLVFSLLFLRALLGAKTACLAFLFAVIPSEQFMTVTYVPWGYGEIMASCAATLWLAALWRREGALWQRLCFGLSVGIGIWFSLQTLMIALPAVVWIAIKRRGAMVEESVPALFGAIAGALPFLLGNVSHGFVSLTQNWASRPASSISLVWSNFIWLMTYMLPKLLFRSSGWWSETTILMAAYIVVAVGFVAALRKKDNPALRDAVALLVLVVVACVLIFSCSQAGTIRGWTVRYIAPLYVVVPLFLAIGIAALWRWSKPLAVATIAALLVPNLLLYGLPGSALRRDLTLQLTNERELLRLLARDKVQMVYGNYTWVYDLNFDSRERVAGVPFVAVVDYFDYGGQLGTAPVRWALLGGSDEISGLARHAGARGTTSSDGDLNVFIADRPARNAAQLLAELRGP